MSETCNTVDELVGRVRERWPATTGKVVEIREWAGAEKVAVRFRVEVDVGDHRRPVVAEGKTPGQALARVRGRAKCTHGVESMRVVGQDVVCTVCQAKSVPEPATSDERQAVLSFEGKAA
ncbi:MAG: hypothetical protein FJ087_08025 [Deltaproteobacteria bacterium]|nr:hypothetical protein [Deltaproteobacteria bacterium]